MPFNVHPSYISDFMALKGECKIVCLTASTAPMAAVLDEHCDLLLVGDSLAMTIYGIDSTADMTLDIMIRHGKAVASRAKTALVIVDLPAGSYERSPGQARRSALKIMAETGADGVKLEGGEQMVKQVAALTSAGIPVMGHIGLLPQQVRPPKLFEVMGRTEESINQLHLDMEALVNAGAFAIVCEGIVEPVARALALSCPVPTIGIGASCACDGQILVSEDMLGLFDDFRPKFVHHFSNLKGVIAEAAAFYRQAVNDGTFPADNNLYAPAAGVSEQC